MFSTKLASIGLAASLVAILPAAPAQAAGRTFVSAAGNDSNPCTITLPCRLLQAAYNAVAANGQVDVLDPGNYGSLTITGPVSIQGHGWAGMSATTGAAITINSPGATDKIVISGVVLDGFAIANTSGIQFNSGGSLTVRDSVIRNFSGNGISFIITASSPSRLFVSNTQISDNTGDGIGMNSSGTGTTDGVINHVEMLNNLSSGLVVASNGQTMNVTVSDSVSSDNGLVGIVANSLTGHSVSVMVRNSTIANNSQTGLSAINPGSTVRVSRSTITGNLTGWASSGAMLSYADNNIDGNTNVNTEPPNPLTYR